MSFSEDSQPAEKDQLPNIPDWDEQQRLAAEKEILGFFVSGHPLEKYLDKLRDFHALDSEAICAMKQGTGKDEITTGGIITSLRVLKSKKGDLYAQAQMEDMAGAVDAIIFPEAYRRLQDRLKSEVPMLVKGSVRVEEGASPKLAISQLTPLSEAQPKLPRSIRIRVPLETAMPGTIDALYALFHDHRGEAKVLFDVERAGDFMAVMEAEDYNVHPDGAFVSRVEELCGKGSVRVID